MHVTIPQQSPNIRENMKNIYCRQLVNQLQDMRTEVFQNTNQINEQPDLSLSSFISQVRKKKCGKKDITLTPVLDGERISINKDDLDKQIDSSTGFVISGVHVLPGDLSAREKERRLQLEKGEARNINLVHAADKENGKIVPKCYLNLPSITECPEFHPFMPQRTSCSFMEMFKVGCFYDVKFNDSDDAYLVQAFDSYVELHELLPKRFQNFQKPRRVVFEDITINKQKRNFYEIIDYRGPCIITNFTKKKEGRVKCSITNIEVVEKIDPEASKNSEVEEKENCGYLHYLKACMGEVYKTSKYVIKVNKASSEAKKQLLIKNDDLTDSNFYARQMDVSINIKPDFNRKQALLSLHEIIQQEQQEIIYNTNYYSDSSPTSIPIFGKPDAFVLNFQKKINYLVYVITQSSYWDVPLDVHVRAKINAHIFNIEYYYVVIWTRKECRIYEFKVKEVKIDMTELQNKKRTEEFEEWVQEKNEINVTVLLPVIEDKSQSQNIVTDAVRIINVSNVHTVTTNTNLEFLKIPLNDLKKHVTNDIFVFYEQLDAKKLKLDELDESFYYFDTIKEATFIKFQYNSEQFFVYNLNVNQAIYRLSNEISTFKGDEIEWDMKWKDLMYLISLTNEQEVTLDIRKMITDKPNAMDSLKKIFHQLKKARKFGNNGTFIIKKNQAGGDGGGEGGGDNNDKDKELKKYLFYKSAVMINFSSDLLKRSLSNSWKTFNY